MSQKQSAKLKSSIKYIAVSAVMSLSLITSCNMQDNNNQGGVHIDTQYHIGDVVKANDIVYRVNSVTDKKELGKHSEYGLNPTTEFNFAVVNFSVKNDSKEEFYCSSMTDLYYYRGDNKYEVSGSSHYEDSNFILGITIGASLTKQFSVAFEIPTEHKSTDYVLVRGNLSKTAKIYLY